MGVTTRIRTLRAIVAMPLQLAMAALLVAWKCLYGICTLIDRMLEQALNAKVRGG